MKQKKNKYIFKIEEHGQNPISKVKYFWVYFDQLVA